MSENQDKLQSLLPGTTCHNTLTTVEELGNILEDVKIRNENDNNDDDDVVVRSNILLCDAGYGFPREKVPRKEKIYSIAGQLANFIQWQLSCRQQKEKTSENGDKDERRRKKRFSSNLAAVRVVGCPDETIRSTLETRILEKLSLSEIPDHVQISCDTMEQFFSSVFVVVDDDDGSSGSQSQRPVYLSPDAEEALDPSDRPPNIVVVGMLIDRRVQPNRSKNRASNLGMVAKRWPLEDCFIDISAKEPLNVDCVLEGMQQWWWNCDETIHGGKECFMQAASQAIDHHAKRHPSRPLHLSGS
jgi:hypothetical protein